MHGEKNRRDAALEVSCKNAICIRLSAVERNSALADVSEQHRE
jgi:hypothetical protein